jgi:hypothetical protein
MESSVSYTELVPLGKKPPDEPPYEPKPIRRAPSYSDSFLVLHAPKTSNTTNAPVFEYLDLAPVSSAGQLAVVEEKESSGNSWIQKTAEVATGFAFHIFLISIFESVFFRLFIAKSEDKGILTTVQRLVGSIENGCQTWNRNVTATINDILSVFVNASQIVIQSSIAEHQRFQYNQPIFARSWIYVGSLGGVVLLFSILSAWKGWISKQGAKRIVLENLGLVCLLGAYEYMFFSTVIYQYDSISVSEIEGNIVQSLHNQCGLFQL